MTTRVFGAFALVGALFLICKKLLPLLKSRPMPKVMPKPKGKEEVARAMGAAAEEEVVVEVPRVSAGRPRANRAASRRAAAAASVRRPLARMDLLTLIPSMKTRMTRSKAAVMSTTMSTRMDLRTRRTERRTMRRRRRMCATGSGSRRSTRDYDDGDEYYSERTTRI